jgi:hypothetical protein
VSFPISILITTLYRRYTLTTDPEITKEKILQLRQENKFDKVQRRKMRQIGRMIDDVEVGQTVKGIVYDVVSQGVLVKVTSLPFNTTGLIGKVDLPTQYSIPADIKESIQRQLLQQDFVRGREVTCGVIAKSSQFSTNMLYTLRLVLEEFGPIPGDDVEIPDDIMDFRDEDMNEVLNQEQDMVSGSSSEMSASIEDLKEM